MLILHETIAEDNISKIYWIIFTQACKVTRKHLKLDICYIILELNNLRNFKDFILRLSLFSIFQAKEIGKFSRDFYFRQNLFNNLITR